MRPLLLAIALGFLGSVLASCNPTPVGLAASSSFSPLVGKWTGKSDMKDKGLGRLANSLAGGPLTGPSRLTLEADGTGFLKVADTPEKPISWRQEGRKVILQTRNITPDQGNSSDTKTAGESYVGTLSEDKRTLVLDLDKVTVTLNKQTDSDK